MTSIRPGPPHAPPRLVLLLLVLGDDRLLHRLDRVDIEQRLPPPALFLVLHRGGPVPADLADASAARADEAACDRIVAARDPALGARPSVSDGRMVVNKQRQRPLRTRTFVLNSTSH